MAMLAGLSSAARLLLLVLANPNWLLFVKNIKIAKVGENRALEVTTYSRNAIVREVPVAVPSILPPPPPPPPPKGLPLPLPALAAISGLAVSSRRTIGTPTVRSISSTSASTTAKLLKPATHPKPAASAQAAARRAEEREQGKLAPSSASLPSRPPRPSSHLPLLMTAIGAAATARGLLLPSHLKVDVPLPPLLEATCGLGLPLLAGATATLLLSLTLALTLTPALTLTLALTLALTVTLTRTLAQVAYVT